MVDTLEVQIIMEVRIMSRSEITRKLRQMKLSVMASEFESQESDSSFAQLSFSERLGQLVDMEYESRLNNSISKLIKQAHLSYSSACIEDINYAPERKLDRSLIKSLATNRYIDEGLNIILVGATGSGKTWLSNAFGVNACRSRYRTLYIRLPELFSKIEMMRIQGKYHDYLNQLRKYDLLILDEFLLQPTNESERADLLEIIEMRCNSRSIIFCSQYAYDGWHKFLNGGPIADAILDRVTNSSYLITLNGKSLRETYSKIKKTE